MPKRKRCLTDREIRDLVHVRRQISQNIIPSCRVMSDQKRSSMEQHIDGCDDCSKKFGDYCNSMGPDEYEDIYAYGAE